MNKHFRYLRQLLLHEVLNPMGDAMAVAYREFSINDNVQVNIEIEPHFSHETFV